MQLSTWAVYVSRPAAVSGGRAGLAYGSGLQPALHGYLFECRSSSPATESAARSVSCVSPRNSGVGRSGDEKRKEKWLESAVAQCAV